MLNWDDGGTDRSRGRHDGQVVRECRLRVSEHFGRSSGALVGGIVRRNDERRIVMLRPSPASAVIRARWRRRVSLLSSYDVVESSRL